MITQDRDASTYIFKYRFLILALTYLVAFYISGNGSTLNFMYTRYNFSLQDLRLFVLSFALIGFFGFLIRFWASGFMIEGAVHSGAIRTDALITSGPYSHTRNPLYFGMLMIAFGFLPELSPTGFAVLMALLATIIVILSSREKRALLAAYGNTYEAYVKSVPAFLPSIKPRIQGKKAKFSLHKAIKTEMFSIYAFAPFAAMSLNGFYFEVTFLLLIVTGFVLSRIVWKTP